MFYMYLAKEWQLNVDAASKNGSEVAGTGTDVAESRAPHKFPALLLHQSLDLEWSPHTRTHHHAQGYR